MTKLEIYKDALEAIASWEDGELGPHMDEPHAARVARAALQKGMDAETAKQSTASAHPGWVMVPREVVERVLEEAPCDCSDRMRFDRGEHMSGCYLFDLSIAAAPTAPAAPAEQASGEKILRRLLAVHIAGAKLYFDDGELQDASEHPHIDFKRDTPEELESKLRARGLKRLEQAQADKVDAELFRWVADNANVSIRRIGGSTVIPAGHGEKLRAAIKARGKGKL